MQQPKAIQSFYINPVKKLYKDQHYSYNKWHGKACHPTDKLFIFNPAVQHYYMEPACTHGSKEHAWCTLMPS